MLFSGANNRLNKVRGHAFFLLSFDVSKFRLGLPKASEFSSRVGSCHCVVTRVVIDNEAQAGMGHFRNVVGLNAGALVFV